MKNHGYSGHVPTDEDSVFKKWCEVSTCMGVIDCYLTKSLFGKLFWIVVLLTGIILTAWQISMSLMSFMASEPFQVTVSNQLQKDGVDFPNVTVCNYNRIKQSMIKKHGLSPDLLSYVFQLLPAGYDFPSALYPELTNETRAEEAWRQYVAKGGTENMFEFLRLYSHSKSDIFHMVLVNGNFTNLDDITEQFTRFGRCWKINTKFKQQIPGAGNAMQLILNPKLDEYMEDMFFDTFLEQGIVLSFTYVDEPFVPEPIIMAPGTSLSISLATTKHTIQIPNPRLRKPFCNSDPRLKIMNESYTPTSCVNDCFFQGLISYCNCSLAINTNVPYRLCSLSEYSECLMIPGLIDETQMKPCYEKCLRPCSEFYTATASTTVAKYVSTKQRKVMGKMLVASVPELKLEDAERIVESLIKVDIYFADKEISVAETGESNPLFVFIGNIGGQLGLWTGISIMTVIQCFYYLWVYMLSLCKGKIRKKTNRVENSSVLY